MDMNQIFAELDRLYAEGKLDRAELRLQEWLREAADTDNKGAALALYNEMEGLYRTTGRAERATGVSERALALVEEMGLKGTIHHATTLLNGATANRAAGNLDKALKMYQEAFSLYRQLGQENSYQMATLYNNISQIYQEKNEHELALSYLEKALAGILALGGGDAEAATTRVNMSLSLTALGRLDEADARLKAALAYYKSEAGKRDPHYASALSAAGELAFRKGQKVEAEACLEEALTVTLKVFGENDACRILRENLEMIRKS